MLNSYSSGGNASASASAKVNNNISINGIGASEAAQLYDEISEKVKGDIIGKSLINIAGIEIGVFQMHRDYADFRNGYSFSYGFRVKTEHSSPQYKDEWDRSDYITGNLFVDIPYDIKENDKERYVYDSIIKKISEDIAHKFEPHVIIKMNEFRF